MKLVYLVQRWWWVAVIALFAVCVSLKLNGSSVGEWQILLKEQGPIRGLLSFHPREVRADEWCHTTPSMLSQARHSPPFPIENESLGAGNSPLLMNVPAWYYTMFFRPQLWGFFIFDFEHAFAFYWCLKVFALPLAIAWLLRQIGIQSTWIVAFGTAWIFFSSFVQWWFSSPAALPEMLACWAMLTGCTLKMFSNLRPSSLPLSAAGFVFFGTSFALCMYPSYQIPLFYVGAAIVVGTWLQRRGTRQWRGLQGLILLLSAVVIVFLVLTPFWLSIRDTLRMVAATSYPGVFRTRGGGLSLFDLFTGTLGFFESEHRIPFHYENICEASNFYPLWALAVPIMVVARWRKSVPIPSQALSLAAVIAVIGTYCVLPVPQWMARGSLLGLALEERLLLGIGVAGILLACIFFDSYRHPILERSGAVALTLVGACGIAGALWFRPCPQNPGFCALIILINCFLLGTFFWNRGRTWFLTIFIALIVFNGAGINPIMQGLSPLIGSRAFAKIEQLHASDPNAGWVVYEDERLPQLVKATGATTLNGTKILPDYDFMRSLDSDGRFAWIYNRFAHVKIVLPDSTGAVTFSVIGSYDVEIGLPPEHPALRMKGYSFVIFPHLWINPREDLFSFVEQITPSDLYVFKLQKKGD